MRIRVVSWNIDKRTKPWRELKRMAQDGEADLALLQEAGRPPEEMVDRVGYEDQVFWSRHLYDRWPQVVRLSDRIAVKPYRQVPPSSDLAEHQIGVSGIGTLAAARVIPRDSEAGAFVAVSVYASWLTLHPSANGSGIYADASAHRILSDLSAFICSTNTEHRILAAGRPEHVLRGDGHEVDAGTRGHGVGADEGARAGVAGAAGPARPVRGECAGRCAARHEERADVLSLRRAGGCGEPVGLRVRVARLPQERVGASDEQRRRVGA